MRKGSGGFMQRHVQILSAQSVIFSDAAKDSMVMYRQVSQNLTVDRVAQIQVTISDIKLSRREVTRPSPGNLSNDGIVFEDVRSYVKKRT
jgi:hypothetical protein